LKPSRATTLHDVARAARVSRTTASAALGGTGRISAATRERVRAAAGELGYVANATARHLKAGRKGAIGIYVAENLLVFGSAFYMEFVRGSAEVANQEGLAVTLIPASSASEAPAVIGHLDGAIIVDPMPGDVIVGRLLESGLPVIAAERHLDPGPQPIATIETDYVLAERELLDHLWDRGARAIALLSISVGSSVWLRLEDGYQSWCEERNLKARLHLLNHPWDADGIQQEARAMLEVADPPDAVLAAVDGTALAVLGAARAAGRHVGIDFLVASCIDSPAIRLVTPAITAIEAPPREIGRDAARLLLAVLRGDEVPANVRRKRPQLALRESTAGILTTA
jgi:DNA-binding LacI/PurR family transcriptional regulator